MPAVELFDKWPEQVVAEMHAVLDAVAEAPPPSFAGGGKWEAMHGTMAGLYEIRVAFGGRNYRLFCLLEREAEDLGGSSIVVVGGLAKPRRQAAAPKDYRRALAFAAEFRRRRTVLG